MTDFKRFFPRGNPKIMEQLVNHNVLKHYGILDNQNRYRMFVSQMAHESGGFRHTHEQISERRAEKRYGVGTRVGKVLGNKKAGDGFRYRGRGMIQLTGRWNYKHYGKKLGLPLEDNPEIAADPKVGLWIALEYWKEKGLNRLSDNKELVSVTKKINGGLNGYADRRRYWKLFKNLPMPVGSDLEIPEPPSAPAPVEQAKALPVSDPGPAPAKPEPQAEAPSAQAQTLLNQDIPGISNDFDVSPSLDAFPELDNDELNT